MSTIEKNSTKAVINQSEIDEIIRLLNDNYLPEEITRILSVDIVCVRFIEHEWARKLVQENAAEDNELNHGINALCNSDYALPKHLYEQMIQERERLAEELSLRGFTVPQLHIATRLDMGASRRIQSKMRSILKHTNAGDVEFPTEKSPPTVPDNLATRLITSLFVTQYKKSKVYLTGDSIESIGSDEELENLKKVVTAWIATREVIKALRLKDLFQHLNGLPLGRKFPFKESYYSLGALYRTSLTYNVSRTHDSRNFTSRMKKYRNMQEDRCTNPRCGAEFVYFVSEKSSRGECPFCELHNALERAMKKAFGPHEDKNGEVLNADAQIS